MGKKTLMNLPDKDKVTDLEKEDLKGPVQKFKLTTYSVSKIKGVVIQGELDSEVFFQGNKIVTYGLNGKRLEERHFDLKGGITIQTFNEKGLDIEYKSFMPDGSPQSYIIKEYNDLENLITMTNYFYPNQSYNSRSIWKNNEMGKPVEFIQYSPFDTLKSISHFKYDENGFNIEQKGKNADGSLINWIKHEINDHGHSIKDTHLNADGSILKVDNHNWEYDSEGKMISSNHGFFGGEEHVDEFENEHDTHENWIKKTYSDKGKPICIQYREINYLDRKSTRLNSIVMDKKEETKVTETLNELVIPTVIEETITGELNGKQLMWLAEGSPTFDEFSALRYYVLMNNSYPSVTFHSAGNIEVVSLLEELKNEMDAEVVHIAYDKESGYDRMTDYTVSFPDNEGYILQVSDINEEDADTYRVPYHIETDDYGNVYSGSVHLLHPNDASGERDEDFESEIENMIENCSLEYIPQKPYIYMIQASGPQWYIKHYSVNDSFEIKDLDLNYGPGFTKFDQDLMNRFKSETKGLILLHGVPRTGKTYYIRHLLRSMLNNNKVVIYMPPNMVDHLTEPGFMTFISQQVSSF